MPTNTNVAFRLAEAFARHGVTVTFGQSLPSAFHLAAPHVGITQASYRQENAGGAMADGSSGMHHSPDFAVADESLRMVAGVLAASAVDLAQG